MLHLAVLSLLPVLGSDPGSDPLPATQDVAEAAEEEPQLPKWTGSVLLGITEIQGNTEEFSAAFDANATRESEHDRVTLKTFFRYRETGAVPAQKEIGNPQSEVTERKGGISGQYDWLAGERYFYFGTAGVEFDDRAMLDLRYYAGGGVGYDFYDTEKFDLSGELGLTYFVEEYADGSDSDDITLILGYDLLYAFSEKTRFTQDFQAFPVIDDPDDVFLRLESALETSLTDSMVASAKYVLDWDSTPAPGAKRDDHRFVISLGWTFGA